MASVRFTVLALMALILIASTAAQSPSSSPKKPSHAASPSPAADSPRVSPKSAPSPATGKHSHAAPPSSSPSPALPPSSISSPPADAPAPAVNTAASNSFAVAGSLLAALCAVAFLM